MCGIAGIMGRDDERLIKRMVASIKHRGPDGQGFYQGRHLHLGTCRLSIIDLQFGWQPMYNEARDKCVVFNGEIYNYKELRRHLLEKGHTLTTHCDTEVIIHLYEEYGARCVEYLQGMFAIAIADGDRLFLARDRLGLKPLYYAFLPEQNLFLFASEIKALLQCEEIDCTLNMQALIDSMVLFHPVEDHTFFQHIRAFLPGHTMTVSMQANGQLELASNTYYRPALAPDAHMTFAEAQEQLTHLLRASVASHLQADVPIGLSLSGGLDSSVLAMAMQEGYHQRLLTFTVADSADHPDATQAALIATHLNTAHHVVDVTFADFFDAMPISFAAAEMPIMPGSPFFLLCKKISEHVKVALIGEGADELFGGYREYIDRTSLVSRMKRSLDYLAQVGLAPSASVPTLFDRLASAGTFADYLKQVFEINMGEPLVHQHLEFIDKQAMAASLEYRVPYLDDAFVAFAHTLPLRFKVNRHLGIQKHILKRVAVDTYGPALLDVALRQKIGLPSSSTKHQVKFRQLCQAVLPDDYLKKHAFGAYFLSKDQLLLFDLFIEIFQRHRGILPADFAMLAFVQELASGPIDMRLYR
ncbi:MAG: asparagine synthase (glutamine-hydrolyzing) [Ktedonobacteraceae bacterium]|nr:asparagine synthase (glutamine-hydrolyzing) [Ktedonobacteraceae bacterium]